MTEMKKKRFAVFIPMLLCLIGAIGVSAFWMQEYRQLSFEQISKFSGIMIEEYSEVEPRVLSAVKEYMSMEESEIRDNDFLEQYGYSSNEFWGERQRKMLVPCAILLIMIVGSFTFVLRYLDKRNRTRIMELTNYLEKINTGAGGTVIQIKEDEFSHLQDEIYKTVTSLYRTRKAAVQAKRNFADNLANIAHQLKTPITAAFLSLQLMKKTTPNVYGEQIEGQLERLNRLEESLLTLSKIDSGTLPMEYSQVDIYTALNLASENLNDLLVKEQISVDIPENGCVEIYGDLEWTMEALMNLMKNCMEHSKPGGVIHCDYSGNPLYAEILIWDDGEGFQTEDIPHLFERFYRGKKAVGNGIGIGLSLAKSIFEMQNGNITARNLPEGGACFEVRVYFTRNHPTGVAGENDALR